MLDFLIHGHTVLTAGAREPDRALLASYSGRNLDHISGIFPNLGIPRGVRGPNLVRSTRLVELSSPVSPETLAESTEACQLRPKRPFLGNESINSVSRRALLVFLNGPI